MKAAIVVALSLLAAVASAEGYSLTISSAGRDRHRIDGSALTIRTERCSARIWRAKATLQFTPELKSSDSLIFKGGSSCRVVGIDEWKGVPYRRR